jgi:ribosome maturation factor RimP
MKSDIAIKVAEYVRPILEQEQVELVDLIYRYESGPHSGAGRNVLRLLVDKPGGVTLDDLTRLNRGVSQILDESALIEQSFVLEVNSPGLDRPLVTRRDYERNINKTVRLILKNQKGATDIVTGDVKVAAEDRVVLDIKGAESVFLFKDIIKARLEIKL